jgi:hypothetical protein
MSDPPPSRARQLWFLLTRASKRRPFLTIGLPMIAFVVVSSYGTAFLLAPQLAKRDRKIGHFTEPDWGTMKQQIEDERRQERSGAVKPVQPRPQQIKLDLETEYKVWLFPTLNAQRPSVAEDGDIGY